MSTKQLMEAAADILSGSKKTASAMPMQKLPGSEAVDLGGPKVDNSKPMDDSNKINGTKAAKSATAPTTKPSAASPDTQNHPQGGKKTMREEEEEVSDEVISEEDGLEVDFSSDINALFEGNEQLSEDFKEKAATIFEARVLDRVQQIQEEMESQYASMLEEAVANIQTELTEKVDDYLNYVVEQWMEENQIAIESGLRSELTEDFIAGLRNLFAEHYIDVPEDKVDLVEELASKVEELEGQLNEEMERSVEYRKALIESVKNEIANEVCEGLTVTQVEKIKSLAESVQFSGEDEYRQKLETIRENYFPSNVRKAESHQLHETFEDETKTVITDPVVAAVSKAISKTRI